jgi:hypothetical protein
VLLQGSGCSCSSPPPVLRQKSRRSVQKKAEGRRGHRNQVVDIAGSTSSAVKVNRERADAAAAEVSREGEERQTEGELNG